MLWNVDTTTSVIQMAATGKTCLDCFRPSRGLKISIIEWIAHIHSLILSNVKFCKSFNSANFQHQKLGIWRRILEASSELKRQVADGEYCTRYRPLFKLSHWLEKQANTVLQKVGFRNQNKDPTLFKNSLFYSLLNLRIIDIIIVTRSVTLKWSGSPLDFDSADVAILLKFWNGSSSQGIKK
jgi:hypothetical protein